MKSCLGRVEPGFYSMLSAERLCCYLVFLSGFFGVAIFAIDVGTFELFPYRIFMLFLWGLFVARVLIQGKVALPRGHIRLYMAFFCIWIAYSVISLIWAASTADAVRDVVFLLMGASLIFFAVYYFRDTRDLSKLYWIWVGVFCGLVFLGFWEHLTGYHLPVSTFYGETRALLMYRPSGVFHNPNDYATFLALSVPFALALIRYDKSRLFKIVGLGVAIAAIFLIVETGSRANILAVLLEICTLLVFFTRPKKNVKVAVAVVLCLVVMVLIFISPVQVFPSKIMAELGSLAHQEDNENDSVGIRAILVWNSLEFLYSTGGFGIGAGNVEYWMANFASRDTAGILNAHNWWVEILVNYGILIFAGYVVIYFDLIFRLWSCWWRRKVGVERMITEALVMSLVGFSVASISSSSIMAFNPNWMLFAFAMAFLNAERHVKRRGC